MKKRTTLIMLLVCGIIFANAQTNVALKPQKTATASSGDASLAIDGLINGASRWIAAENTPQWIKVDLGSDRDISKVKITWEGAKAATFTVTFITDAGVTLTSETINGTNPIELVDKTVNDFSANAKARYVQIDCQTGSTGYPYSIYEIEITDDAPNPIASASSEVNPASAASKANDGDKTGTRWESAWPTAVDADPFISMDQWLMVDLGKKYDLSKVDIYWQDAKAEEYLIQVSDDASDASWTTVATITGNVPANDKHETHPITASGRYVRIYCTKRALGNYGYSIFELEVYDVPPVLPVALLDFQTKLQTNGQVTLNWSTASELNNSHFIIEKSTDGKTFSKIAEVASKNSNSNARLNYAYVDANPINGINYYKLTQVDFNGSNKTLGVRSQKVNINMANSVLYPNPLEGNKFYLSLANQPDGQVSVSISNLLGKSIYQGRVNVVLGTASVSLSAKPAPGLYLVKVEEQTLRLIVE